MFQSLSPPSNPYDYQSWESIFNSLDISDYSAISKQQFDSIISLYQQYLSVFPYLHIYWSRYASVAFSNTDSYSDAIVIFKKATSPNILKYSVEMWNEYIKFFQIHYSHAESSEMMEIFFEALKAIGRTYKSGSIWKTAIEFLKKELKKSPFFMLANAISCPIEGLYEFWDELQSYLSKVTVEEMLIFENYGKENDMKLMYQKLDDLNNINDIDERSLRASVAKKLNDDYMKAKENYAKRMKFENAITRSYFHFLALDEAQICNWECYIETFKNLFQENKSDESFNDLIEIYERAIIPCNYVESIWFDYANFIESTLGENASREIYSRIPFNVLPHLKVVYAEFEEEYSLENAKQVYDSLIHSDYAEHVIAAAEFYFRHNDLETAKNILRTSRDRMLQNNDMSGASAVSICLLEIANEHSEGIYSAAYISKYARKLISENHDDEANSFLFDVTQGEHSSQLLLEDRISLIQIYIECCRTWGVEASFQIGLELEYNKLKNKLLWHKSFFEQRELKQKSSPESKYSKWLEYQRNLQ